MALTGAGTSLRAFTWHSARYSLEVMPMRRYSPPIERVREEYARECARRAMRLRQGPRLPGPKLSDNSEPWITEPRTVAELWEIAQNVARTAERWGPSA